MTRQCESEQLTNRQEEILELLAKGLSNKDISELLNISFNTVKNHIANILANLNVSNRTEATLIYNQRLQQRNAEGDQPHAIAVLPFRYNDKQIDDYLVEGLLSDLVSKLSSWRWFPVVSSLSSYQYLHANIPHTQIAAELGVRYLITGSVQRHDSTLRFHLEVLDALTRELLASDRFEGDIKSFFQMQEALAVRIVATLFPEIHEHEVEHQQTDSLSAWALACKGQSRLKSLTAEANYEAQAQLEQALAIDNKLLSASFGLAECYYQRLFNGWAKMPENPSEKLQAAANHCVDIAPKTAHAQLAQSLAFLAQGDMFAAVECLRTAVSYNPSLAPAHSLLGQLVMLSGEPSAGIAHLLKSLQLSPRDPRLWSFHSGLGMAYYAAQDYSRAAMHMLLSLQDKPGIPTSLATLAACHGMLGHSVQAQQAVAALLALEPDYRLSAFSSILSNAKPEYLARYAQGLRLAGLSESHC